jgi:hypothetical protein
LEALLEHQCADGNGDCPECQGLERIYQFMRARLFSTVIYTGTPLEPHGPAQSQSQPVNRAAVEPRRPQAA